MHIYLLTFNIKKDSIIYNTWLSHITTKSKEGKANEF